VDWLILYDDGSTFTNLDGAPHEAPRSGVMQTFYMDDATGVSVESSPIGHWIWKRNRWFGVDDHMGFWDYLFHYPEPCVAIFGRTLHNEEWERRVHEQTIELMKMPKSAWRQRERRP